MYQEIRVERDRMGTGMQQRSLAWLKPRTQWFMFSTSNPYRPLWSLCELNWMFQFPGCSKCFSDPTLSSWNNRGSAALPMTVRTSLLTAREPVPQDCHVQTSNFTVQPGTKQFDTFHNKHWQGSTVRGPGWGKIVPYELWNAISSTCVTADFYRLSVLRSCSLLGLRIQVRPQYQAGLPAERPTDPILVGFELQEYHWWEKALVLPESIDYSCLRMCVVF